MTYLLGLATGLAVWWIDRKLQRAVRISKPGEPFPRRRWYE